MKAPKPSAPGGHSALKKRFDGPRKLSARKFSENRKGQGATEKKQKNSQCTYVLYLAGIELLYTCDDVIFFIAFLSSPHRETPKNALKKS
jgi:hypothetical protein